MNPLLPFPESKRAARAILTKLVAGTLLINAFALALGSLSVYQSYALHQERAEITTRNLARVLQENIDGIVDKVDLALLSVQDEVQREYAAGGPDGRVLSAFLRQQQGYQPEILSLRAMDAKGVVRYGEGVPPNGGPDNSDREYFTLARDNPGAGVVISRPMFARISKQWVVVLARRLSRPDGGFAGVVYANVALNHFANIFSSLDIGPHGTVVLRDRELKLVVRFPGARGQDSAVGSAPAPNLRQAHDLNQEGGTYQARATVDGVERTLSFRKVAGGRFYVIVGMAREDYLAPWWSEVLRVAALLLLFLVGTAFAAALIYRAWKRQRAATNTVREQKEFLDAILENEPECVKVLAPNGDLLQMNRAGLDMLEVGTVQEAKQYGLANFVLPAYREAFVALIRRVLRGEVGVLEFEIEGRNGTRRWLETHATPLYDVQGKIVSLVGVTRDVTARKAAEGALVQLNANLEQRVRDEVAKNLEQERLLIQQSRLAVMGEMIGNIAHQWRQPLNSLSLLLAGIKDAYDYRELNDAFMASSLEKGYGLIQKMSSTIDDFRDFFKPNKAREDFSLGKAVADTLNLIGPSLKSHGVTLRLQEGDDVWVSGYPNELSQVLLNIFSNAREAIQAKQPAEGTVTVSWGREEGKGWIAVRDDAGGIPPDILPRVFEPYFTTKEKGTGIGLYMSRIIMEHMGGAIQATSLEGGAEFKLWCPLAGNLTAS